MPTYEYECRKCGARFDDMKTMSEIEDPSICPDCGGPGMRVVTMPAMVRGDTTSWSNENKGKGRRISQLDHGVRQPFYAKNQQAAIDEASRRGLYAIKT